MGGSRRPVGAPRSTRAALPAPRRRARRGLILRLVDSHCHLQADRFAGDVELVLGGARLAGVERILVPGWDPESCAAARRLGDRYPWLDVAVGVHPHDASKVDDAGWAQIVAMAQDPRVVAIGETGLDYDRVFSPIEAQLTNLRRNLALALASGKPAILHCRSADGRRDAQDALVGELRAAGFDDEGARLALGGRPPAIIHSFSGPLDYSETVLAMGCVISFSGLVFRSGEEVSAEVARIVPHDRLLVETDSPFLSPPGGPKKRNEPEWVAITARWLAEQRGVSSDELGEQLVATYDAAFPRATLRAPS